MELMDVVNEDDEVIGVAERQEVYEKKLLHRIVHVLLYNDRGELLLQLRGPEVSYLPLHWSTSVGGHVHAGESYEEAAAREMQEELGVAVPITNFSKLRFVKEATGHNKFLGVFAAKYSGEFAPDAREVADVRFVSLDELAVMRSAGEQFHPELLFIVDELAKMVY